MKTGSIGVLLAIGLLACADPKPVPAMQRPSVPPPRGGQVLPPHDQLRSLTELPATRPALLQQKESLEQRITLWLEQPQTCNDDKDCAALPLGSRPCGGPDRYEAYRRDQPELEQLAQEHRRVSALLNQQERRLGICSVLVAPTPHCRARRCEIRAVPVPM